MWYRPTETQGRRTAPMARLDRVRGARRELLPRAEGHDGRARLQQQDDLVLLDAAAAPRRHDHVVQLRDQEALVDAAVHPQVQGPLD